MLRAAANRFVGAGDAQSAAFAIVYRCFEHGHMRAVCDALDAPTLKGEVRRRLQRDAVSPDTRFFAATFSDIQGARHRADYDPQATYDAVDASSLADSADAAIAAFDRIPPDEQRDLLALLMVRGRA